MVEKKNHSEKSINENNECGNALVQSKQSENLYFDLGKIVPAKLITIQSINMLHI